MPDAIMSKYQRNKSKGKQNISTGHNAKFYVTRKIARIKEPTYLLDKENVPVTKQFNVKTVQDKRELLAMKQRLSSDDKPDGNQTTVYVRHTEVPRRITKAGCNQTRADDSGGIIRDKAVNPSDRSIGDTEDYRAIPGEKHTDETVQEIRKRQSRDRCIQLKIKSEFPPEKSESDHSAEAGTGYGNVNKVCENWAGHNLYVCCMPDVDTTADRLINSDSNSGRRGRTEQHIAESNDQVKVHSGKRSAGEEVAEGFREEYSLETSGTSVLNKMSEQTRRKNKIGGLRKMSEGLCGINSESIQSDENANLHASSSNLESDIIKPPAINVFKTRKNNCSDSAISSSEGKFQRQQHDRKIDKNTGMIKPSDVPGRRSSKFVKKQTDATVLSIKRSISSDQCNFDENTRKGECRGGNDDKGQISNCSFIKTAELQPEVIKDTGSDSNEPISNSSMDVSCNQNRPLGDKVSKLPVINRKGNVSAIITSRIPFGGEHTQNEDKHHHQNKGGSVKTETVKNDKFKSDLPVPKCHLKRKTYTGEGLISEIHDIEGSRYLQTPSNSDTRLSSFTNDDKKVRRLQSTQIPTQRLHNTSTNANSNVTEQVSLPSPRVVPRSPPGSTLNTEDNRQVQTLCTTDVGNRGHGELRSEWKTAEVGDLNETSDRTRKSTNRQSVRDSRLSLQSDLRAGSYVYWGFGSRYRKATSTAKRKLSDVRDLCSALIGDQLRTDCDGQMEINVDQECVDYTSIQGPGTDDFTSDPFKGCHGSSTGVSTATHQETPRTCTRHRELKGHAEEKISSSGANLYTERENCSDSTEPSCVLCEQGNYLNCVQGQCVMNAVKSEKDGLDIHSQRSNKSDEHIKELDFKFTKTVSLDKNLDEGVVNSTQVVSYHGNTLDLKDGESVTTCKIDNFIDSKPSEDKHGFERKSSSRDVELNPLIELERKSPVVCVDSNRNIALTDPPTFVTESEAEVGIGTDKCQLCSPGHCLCTTNNLCDPRGITHDTGIQASPGDGEATLTCAKISNNNKNPQSANSLTFTEVDECGNSFRLMCLSSDREKVKQTGKKVIDLKETKSYCEGISYSRSDDYYCEHEVSACTESCDIDTDLEADDTKYQLRLPGDGDVNYSKQNESSRVSVDGNSGGDNYQCSKVSCSSRDLVDSENDEDDSDDDDTNDNKGRSHESSLARILSDQQVTNFNEITKSDDRKVGVANGMMVDSLPKDVVMLSRRTADDDGGLIITSYDKVNDMHIESMTASIISNENVDYLPDVQISKENRGDASEQVTDKQEGQNSDSGSQQGHYVHSSAPMLQTGDINCRVDKSKEKPEVNIDRKCDIKEHRRETVDSEKVNEDNSGILSAKAPRRIQNKHQQKDATVKVTRSNISAPKFSGHLKARSSKVLPKTHHSNSSDNSSKSVTGTEENPNSDSKSKPSSKVPKADARVASGNNTGKCASAIRTNPSVTDTSKPSSVSKGRKETSEKCSISGLSLQTTGEDLKTKATVTVKKSENIHSLSTEKNTIESKQIRSNQQRKVISQNSVMKTQSQSIPTRTTSNSRLYKRQNSSSSSPSSSRNSSKESSPEMSVVKSKSNPSSKKDSQSGLKTNSFSKQNARLKPVHSDSSGSKLLKPQASNSNSCSSSRMNSKESSPEVIKTTEKEKNEKEKPDAKGIASKISLRNTTGVNSVTKKKTEIPRTIPKNNTVEAVPAAESRKAIKIASTHVKVQVKEQSEAAKFKSASAVSRSNQSSPALSRSSRCSTPNERKGSVTTTGNKPSPKSETLECQQSKKQNTGTDATKTNSSSVKSKSVSKNHLSKKPSVTTSSRQSSIPSTSVNKTTVSSTSTKTKKSTNENSRSRSNTPSDPVVGGKLPVQSKSTCSQASYDKSPVFSRKTKPLTSKNVKSENKALKSTISGLKGDRMSSTTSKLPLASSSVKSSEKPGNKPRTITPVSWSNSVKSIPATRASSNKTCPEEKKNARSDIAKNQSKETGKIKITTGDYLSNKKSVKSDSEKKLPSRSYLSPGRSLTSISHRNQAKMQHTKSSEVENLTEEEQQIKKEPENRCKMSENMDENEFESKSESTIKTRNQSLSYGDLFTSTAYQKEAVDLQLQRCTNNHESLEDKDEIFKRQSKSESETSEEYWSVSGDDTSETMDQSAFSEAMESLSLTNHSLGVTLSSLVHDVDHNETENTKHKFANSTSCIRELQDEVLEKQLPVIPPLLPNALRVHKLGTQEQEDACQIQADDNVIYRHENSTESKLKEYVGSNKDSFDLMQGDGPLLSKCKTNCESGDLHSATVCKKDKEQYVPHDIEENVHEPTNLVEYFDENVDKSDAPINETGEGPDDPRLMGSYFRDRGDMLNEGSEDSMSHLSMKNIMTHSKSENVVCYSSETVRDKEIRSGLLTFERGQSETLHTRDTDGIKEFQISPESGDLLNKTSQQENSLKNILSDLDTKSPEVQATISSVEANSTDGVLYLVCNINSESSKETCFCANENDDINRKYSKEQNDDHCSLSSSEDLTDDEGLVDANMNEMCIKTEMSGETSRRITRQQRIITRRERSVKYETLTTTNSDDAHGGNLAHQSSTSTVFSAPKQTTAESCSVQTSFHWSSDSTSCTDIISRNNQNSKLIAFGNSSKKWTSSSVLPTNILENTNNVSAGKINLVKTEEAESYESDIKEQTLDRTKSDTDSTRTYAYKELEINREQTRDYKSSHNERHWIRKDGEESSSFGTFTYTVEIQSENRAACDNQKRHSGLSDSHEISVTNLKLDNSTATSVAEDITKPTNVSSTDIKEQNASHNKSSHNQSVQIDRDAELNCQARNSESGETLGNTSHAACFSIGYHNQVPDDIPSLLVENETCSDSYDVSQMVDRNTAQQQSDTKDIYLPEITEETDKPRLQYDNVETYQTDQKTIDTSQLPKESKIEEDSRDNETSALKSRKHFASSIFSETKETENCVASNRQANNAGKGEIWNHKSLGEIEMSDSVHSKNNVDRLNEVKTPAIRITDSKEVCSDSGQTKSSDQDGSLSRTSSKKDRSRQGIRRFTATVCLVDKQKDGTNETMTPSQKPRARSKSPIQLRNESSGTVESKQIVNVGHKRVSEICQSFLKKATRGTISERTADSVSPTSSVTQSPALGKKLKWVNDGGKWKRIPMDLGTVSESTSDIPAYRSKPPPHINKSRLESQNDHGVLPEDPCEESDTYTKDVSSIIKQHEQATKEAFQEERVLHSPEKMKSEQIKPKQPPKTLPKPSEEARRQILSKNAVAKWTSFSQKRLSWRSENEKLANEAKKDESNKTMAVHGEIFETLPEKHIKSPTQVLSMHAQILKGEIGIEGNQVREVENLSLKDNKSSHLVSVNGNTRAEISARMSDVQNGEITEKMPKFEPQLFSTNKLKTDVQISSQRNLTLQKDEIPEICSDHESLTKVAKNETPGDLSYGSTIGAYIEVKTVPNETTKQVTNDEQSIRPHVKPWKDGHVAIAGRSEQASKDNVDSDDDVTPTNTPKLRKATDICGETEDEDTPRNTPRLKAVKIKQEMFPREERPKTDDSKSIVTPDIDLGKSNIKSESSVTVNGEEGSDVKFYINEDDSDESENVKVLRKSNIRRSHNDRRRGIYGMDSLQDEENGVTVKCEIRNGLNDSTAMTMSRSPGADRARDHAKGLLSEIVELEGGDRDGSASRKSLNKKGISVDPCRTPPEVEQSKNFNRSRSLPTTSLQGYGQHRIVYKNGHFVIETGLQNHDEQEEDVRTGDGGTANKENMCETTQQTSSTKPDSTRESRKARALEKRRSNSEADLLDNKVEDDSDLDVFLQNDGDVTVIDQSDGEKSPYWHILVKRRTKPLKDESDESSSSRPLSIDESQLQRSIDDMNCEMNKTMPKKSDNIKRRSASFKELRSFKLKRNSSFREAQERGALLRASAANDSAGSVGNLSLSPSEFSVSSESRSKGPGILNRMFRRNKSFSEKGSIAANEPVFEKRDNSKEPKNRKMSLKSLFGKKSKSDSSQSNYPDEQLTSPITPPIAVFQGDLDIHSVDSAPTSPYSSQKFPRRHTAADLYNHRAHTLPRRPSDTPKPQTLTSSNSSVQSLNILNIANCPKRPISPKPTNIIIPRRCSNVSLPTSPLKDGPCDLRNSRRSSENRLDSTDSVSVCSRNSANADTTPTSPPLACDDEGQRPGKTVSSHDLERYTALVQGGEMTSSNSNDSGIQRDVSAHSSNESLKTIQESSSSSTVVRRRKSPSPRQERPKSEISVRWADLVETNEITPVKRRERLSSNKQRPKSDLEDNLSLFDEMYQEVIEDFEFHSGGSSFNDDMKPYGSQVSLLPYSSLQSLDQLRRQDSWDQKPSKRRMSTPHPIKTRLERSPKKQKKRNPLVRSHSMPENLDKLYKKKRFFTTASSNLHKELLRGFDEDSYSDDGSDYSADQISLHEKSLSSRSSSTYLSTLEERPEAEVLTYAEALWDHITMDHEELGFRAGDVIQVADMTDKDWWWGAIDDKEGWFPATFVRLRVNQEGLEEELSSRLEEVTEHNSPMLHRMSVLNKEQARENVVNEIITAERDYVKHLRDVVEGYIKHARKRTDMFTEERISVLFGNMENIYDFSDRFLQKVEKVYNKGHPYLSELGQCFLGSSKEFEIYSDYCNNHPSASEELKELYRKQKYRHFFEACRLLQEMIEIPLEGFLLTPVQKICKYPLQLAELLKYTPPSHPDHQNVAAALEAMKKIAALINERKRKMESIEKLARWQTVVEDWQGADLIEESSELIYSGEMYKINSGGWSQERNFFLFDHQLIYCKKDLLKRNGYSYRGRVDLDDCEVIPVEDGKDAQYNVTVKNAWKLHEVVRDKWYLLYTKTDTEKQRWLKAFSQERQRVKEDQENNFVPSDWKRMVLNKIKSSQERGRRTPMPSSDFMRGIPSHATLPRSYSKKVQKKKGWFIFGNKKTK